MASTAGELMVRRAPGGSGRSTAWPLGLAAAGLVTLVIGTFLPWLRSGRSERNSYQADGVIARLLDPHGGLRPVLAVWPFVSLACGLAVALWAVGLRRTGAVLAVAAAGCAGAVAIGSLATHRSALAEVVDSGPVVTLIGAIIVPMAILVLCAQTVRTTRSAR